MPTISERSDLRSSAVSWTTAAMWERAGWSTEGDAENGTHQRGDQHRSHCHHRAVAAQPHRRHEARRDQQQQVVEGARGAVVDQVDLRVIG